jgi:hypothetical protein
MWKYLQQWHAVSLVWMLFQSTGYKVCKSDCRAWWRHLLYKCCDWLGLLCGLVCVILSTNIWKLEEEKVTSNLSQNVALFWTEFLWSMCARMQWNPYLRFVSAVDVGTKPSPWPQSVNELYRPSDRRLSPKSARIFVDRGCHVVSVTDPYGHILKFLDQWALNWGKY